MLRESWSRRLRDQRGGALQPGGEEVRKPRSASVEQQVRPNRLRHPCESEAASTVVDDCKCLLRSNLQPPDSLSDAPSKSMPLSGLSTSLMVQARMATEARAKRVAT